MDNHNSSEEIKSIIDNNTFKINFYKQWPGGKCQQVVGKNGATITGVVTEIQWGKFIDNLKKQPGMKKKIIKIEIGGDISATNNGFIVGTSLSKSRFLNLLEAIALNNDLNNCILIIENNTCAEICALPEQVGNYCEGKCSEDDKIENVVRNYMKEKKIDNNTFYFGNRYNKSFNDNDPRFPEQYGADYMQRIEGDKCDTFDIYEKKFTGENGCFIRGKKNEQQENKYYSSLYQDLQNLLSNKKTYTNDRNVGVPTSQTTQQQNQNNSNQYNININGVATNGEGGNISFRGNLTEKNNENVLCDLTKGFCSCCKCW